MLNLKYLSHFSLALFLLVITAVTPLKAHAQDEMPVSDDEIITPQGTSTPPVIIDESDGGSVQDTEEYDG